MKKEIEKIIHNWLDEPKESAKRLIEYYGEPDDYSNNKLIWFNTSDGWKRTILTNEMIPHSFPAEHNDYLEQFIDYKVPINMYSKLVEYDGSVIAERTRGELSARCGGTSMNFVAINLAHEIIEGKRSVEEARKEYSRLYKAFKNGEKPVYTQKFIFDLPKGNTKDPDVVTLH